jgi:hypothetical protein
MKIHRFDTTQYTNIEKYMFVFTKYVRYTKENMSRINVLL